MTRGVSSFLKNIFSPVWELNFYSRQVLFAFPPIKKMKKYFAKKKRALWINRLCFKSKYENSLIRKKTVENSQKSTFFATLLLEKLPPLIFLLHGSAGSFCRVEYRLLWIFSKLPPSKCLVTRGWQRSERFKTRTIACSLLFFWGTFLEISGVSLIIL